MLTTGILLAVCSVVFLMPARLHDSSGERVESTEPTPPPSVRPVLDARSSPIEPVQRKVTRLELDLDGRAAHIPGEGWITAERFWQIYLWQPSKLPTEIDFELLFEFEQLTKAARARAERSGKLSGGNDVWPSEDPASIDHAARL